MYDRDDFLMDDEVALLYDFGSWPVVTGGAEGVKQEIENTKLALLKNFKDLVDNLRGISELPPGICEKEIYIRSVLLFLNEMKRPEIDVVVPEELSGINVETYLESLSKKEVRETLIELLEKTEGII